MKEGILRYVNLMRKFFIGVSVVFVLVFMVSLVFAFSGYLAFIIIAPALLIAYFVFYGFYELKISMGVVLGVEPSAEVVHLKTRRKTFTYDIAKGCRAVKVYKSKFVCTFETQDSSDTFTFYKRAPFSKAYEAQFTEADIRKLFPDYDERAVFVGE